MAAPVPTEDGNLTVSQSDNAIDRCIPDGVVSLASILCTEELHRRPSRPPDYAKENRALVVLVQALADSPRTILQTLADTILEVFQAGSAGLSLLTTHDGGKRFYWPAIAGVWKPYIGGGTPRDFGPCGDVLDRDTPLLFRHFERRYAYFQPVTPPVEECLLVPFYVEGKAVGTIWAIAHDDRRKFDAEDLRQLESLGRFSSAAYHAVESLEALEQQSKALRRSETRLRDFVDNATVGLHWVGPDGIILWANQRELDLLGYTREEYIGQHITKFHVDEPAIQNILSRLTRGETLHDYEARLRRQDGSIRHVVISSSVLFEDGKFVHTRCFTRDITERKQAEEALREAGERFRFMAESMPQKIFTAKPNGEVDYFNQQWTEFTGLSFEEIKGWGWSQFIHLEDLGESIRRWQHSVGTGEPFQFEHRFRRKDGEYRWHLSRAHAMRDTDGQVLMWIGSNTDIDDHKHAEEHLEKTVNKRTAQLRETVGHLEAFSHSIVHDMRAPLRAMQSFAQILAAECGDRVGEQGKDYIRRIITSADRLDRLILDVLAYSRVARAELELGPVDLEKLLHGMLESYPIFKEPNVEIQVQGALPVVLGNEAALTQCLSNLLGNAVKFVVPGTVPRVRVWTEMRAPVSTEPQEERVRLFVQDNGIGIATDVQEKIFEMFQRVSNEHEGTGIGLAIVKMAVERMHGKVGVQSEPGKGSTFWLELKRASTEAKHGNELILYLDI